MRKLNKISSEFFNKCPEDKELSEMINRVGSEIKKSIKTLQGNQEEEIEKHYLNFKLKLVEISSDFLNKCPENKEILGMIDRIGSEIDRPLLIAKMRF